MKEIVIRAVSLILIIFTGYVLKKIKFFSKTDYKLISKIVFTFTLPMAIIKSFIGFEKDSTFLIFAAFGFLFNVIIIVFSMIYYKREDDKTKIFNILNLSGYNIGVFALPFMQNFIGSLGVVTACMFDIGNSVMCTGGTYLTVSQFYGTDEKINIITMIKKMCSSIPFVVYNIMLVMMILDIKIPIETKDVFEIAGGANSFLSMLMIGMMFEIKFEKYYFGNAFKLLAMRYIMSSICAFVFYKYMPFPLIIRQIISIILFSPIPSLAPIFIEKSKGNIEMAGFMNSFSIMISTIIMTILFFKFNY